ncbi:hypothetical protein HYY74_00470 [Candidatus Woesearchaeota archaeon]|nr:hypothetical protein [Candidatus Woesearchaeota archaeon]
MFGVPGPLWVMVNDWPPEADDLGRLTRKSRLLGSLQIGGLKVLSGDCAEARYADGRYVMVESLNTGRGGFSRTSRSDGSFMLSRGNSTCSSIDGNFTYTLHDLGGSSRFFQAHYAQGSFVEAELSQDFFSGPPVDLVGLSSLEAVIKIISAGQRHMLQLHRYHYPLISFDKLTETHSIELSRHLALEAGQALVNTLAALDMYQRLDLEGRRSVTYAAKPAVFHFVANLYSSSDASNEYSEGRFIGDCVFMAAKDLVGNYSQRLRSDNIVKLRPVPEYGRFFAGVFSPDGSVPIDQRFVRFCFEFEGVRYSCKVNSPEVVTSVYALGAPAAYSTAVPSEIRQSWLEPVADPSSSPLVWLPAAASLHGRFSTLRSRD